MGRALQPGPVGRRASLGVRDGQRGLRTKQEGTGYPNTTALFYPLPVPSGRQRPRQAYGPLANGHWRTSALPLATKVDCALSSRIHSGFGLGGAHGPGRVSLSTSGSSHPDKLQCHYGGSCCLRPRGCMGRARTPLLHCAEGKMGDPGTGDPWGMPGGDTAAGLLPVPPSCLPGPRAQSQGGLSPFITGPTKAAAQANM